MKQGLLLVNLGSPDSTAVSDVRAYLREFLMDPRVIDVPKAVRTMIVYGFVLPFRPAKSAEAYEKIWTAEGSPLVVTSKHVRDAVAARMPDTQVELAMRYRNPSIADAVERLKSAGVTQLEVFPLFPHYAMSSYETAVERVREVMMQTAPEIKISVVRPYYDQPEYIEALVASARPYLESYDHVLFSFHGVPERHLRKTDPTNCHCLEVQDCCERPSPAHDTCYRAHCFQTVKAFAAKAGLQAGTYSTAFQSRLGRDKWIQPATDQELVRLAAEGKRRIVVICPAFVADCLETVEEIGIRGRELFLSSGGESFTLVPCLNEHPKWIDAICSLAQRNRNTPLLQVTHAR